MAEADESIAREDLARVLGIEIPESAFFEFSITALDDEKPQGDAPSKTSTFRGRLTYSAGRLVDRRRLTSPIEVKKGVVGDAWPG